MNKGKLFKRIMQEFNKKKIRYVILRKSADLDISVHKDDWIKIDKIFRANGYIKRLQNWDKNHICYKNECFSFDIRFLDEWAGIFYLDEGIYCTRIKKQDMYYPLDVYNLAHYVGHCLLGKRKWKYKKEIKELIKKCDLPLVDEHLRNALGDYSLDLLRLLKKGEFHQGFEIFCLIAIMKHPFTFLKSFISWIIWKLKPYPIIAIIGPDGSGKTTAVNNLKKRLTKYGMPVKTFYGGRGQKNVLPVHQIGKKIKTRRWYHYYVYSFLSFIDLLLRQRMVDKTRKKKIIITDRSYLDIATMKYVPWWLKKIYLNFFDEPGYIFYLRNDADVLHKRRPEHPTADLRRQIACLDILGMFLGYDVKEIKSINEKQVIDDILKYLF